MRRTVLLLDNALERVDRCREALAAVPDIAYRVIHTDSVGESLTMLEHERPDCTVVGWSLPGNGAAAALHRIGTRHSYAPVVMLTEPDEQSWRLEEIRSTCVCHILKPPITSATLHGAIGDAIRDAEDRRRTAHMAALSHSVLIIDDNADDRELCVRALARTDHRYRIIEAETGDSGIALIDQERPDCVILDYSLPGLSGVDVLRRIQAINAFLPVIMLTGRGDEAVAVAAMRAGAQNYLLKSTLAPDLLRQAVSSAIEHAGFERQTNMLREQIYEQKLALTEANRLMSTVLDSAPCMIVVTDANGKVLMFNKELERVVGYTAEEVIGKHTPRLWSPKAPILRRAKALAQGEAGPAVDGPGSDRAEAREMMFVHKDGSKVPVSFWIRNLHNDDGEVVGFLGLGEDISERKTQLAALRTSEATFRSAMENAPCGMALIGLDGRFLKVNKALCEITGCDEAQLCSATLEEFTHPEDMLIGLHRRRRLLAGEISAYEAEKRLIHVSGEPVDIQINLSLVRDAAGEPHYYVAQILDISERKQLDRMKNEFVSVFSHELRTPLTSIRGSLNLLSTESLKHSSGTADNLLCIARRNCERLILLVNDIFDVELLEARHVRIEMQPAVLAGLVHKAIEASRDYARSFGIELTMERVPDDIVVDVDAVRFVQILSNLLSNGVKFSPRGAEVRIAVERFGGCVRVKVSDRGPGIPRSFLPRLFQKFTQLDAGTNRRAGGAGLGLYISQTLAEHMRGCIGVETAEGNGSTFWIELPESEVISPGSLVAAHR